MLVESCAALKSSRPELSREALYKETLLQDPRADDREVDRLLLDAKRSVDAWTNPEEREFGFRELVHFILLSQSVNEGRSGTLVSLDSIVRSMVPEDL